MQASISGLQLVLMFQLHQTLVPMWGAVQVHIFHILDKQVHNATPGLSLL